MLEIMTLYNVIRMKLSIADEDSNEIMIVSPPQLSTNSNNITVVTPLMGFTPLNNLQMARTSWFIVLLYSIILWLKLKFSNFMLEA